MRADNQIADPYVLGHVGLWRLYEPGVNARGRRRRLRKGQATAHPVWGAYNVDAVEQLVSKPNQLQFEWGAIAAFCIGRGNRQYRIATLYVEYENVASPGDPVTVPSFDRDEGHEYYQDLAFSASRDFLRVPLSFEPTIGISSGYEDYFTEGTNGNKLTFFAQTQGSTGFHGKAFSNAANSKVFGVALVASPEFSDQTKDLIFARTYFDTADQTVKQASSQIGTTWEISFL